MVAYDLQPSKNSLYLNSAPAGFFYAKNTKADNALNLIRYTLYVIRYTLYVIRYT